MRGCARSVKLAGWLLAAVLGGKWARAQVATTTVQDTVMDASGAAAQGTVAVSWGAFTTAAGVPVPAGNLSTTLGAGGALNLALQPNAGATPMGSYYTAVYHLSDGTASREFWVVPVAVPGGGPARLAGIRNQVLPSAMAMQTVSKQYVDTTVAKAMAGVTPEGSLPYVLKAGDAMSGPLTLAGDPVQSLQAADKHYVDAAVASGSTAAGSAGGDLSGSYPNPTVSAVHATAGTLNGVTVGGTAPAAGTFTVVQSLGSGNSFGSYAASAGPSDLAYFGTFTDEAIFSINRNPGNGSLANSGRSAAFFKLDANDGTGTMTFVTYTGNGTAITPAFPLFLAGNGAVSVNRSSPCGDGISLCANAGSNFSVDGSGNVIAAGFHEALNTPATSSAGCSAGDFTDDANFHYVCVGAAHWRRVALTDF